MEYIFHEYNKAKYGQPSINASGMLREVCETIIANKPQASSAQINMSVKVNKADICLIFGWVKRKVAGQRGL